MNRRHTAYFYLFLVSIIWGAASPVVKFTLQWFNPWLFLTYRFAISTLIALPYFWLEKTKIPKKSSDVGLVLLTSFISTPLALGLFFFALSKTTALSGSLLTTGGPLLLVLAGALLFHDRVTSTERLGITITVFGTLVTAFGPLLLNGHEDTFGRLEGNLFMIGAIIADIAGAVLSKAALRRGISASLLGQFQFIFGFLLYVPLVLMQQPVNNTIMTITSAPLAAHLGVLFMAVISGTLAYTIRNVAIKTIEISESAIFSYLQPLWAGLLAIWWLKEVITPSYVVGAIIIALGVIAAEHKRSSVTRQKSFRRHKH